MTGNAIVTIDRIERRVASRIVIEIAAGLSRRGCTAKGAMGSRTTPQDTWDEPEDRGWARKDLARFLPEPDHREWAVHEFSYVPDAWS